MRSSRCPIDTVHRSRVRRFPSLVLLATAWLAAPDVLADDRCARPAGEVVSWSGTITIDGRPVRQGQTFCVDATLATGPASRLAVRLAATRTILRIGSDTTFSVENSDPGATLLDLVRGVMHLFSREPDSFRVTTPYVNAAIDGTEFVIDSRSVETRVSVLEGAVRIGNDLGTVVGNAGELVIAMSDRPPAIRELVAPVSAVGWALYYPPIGSGESIDVATRTRLDEAISSLASGATERALRRLESLPHEPIALAFRAMIAVTRNRGHRALALSRRAVERDPDSTLALLARSYAEQSRFRLEAALESARDALANDPRNAHAVARVAELQLSTGDTRGAMATLAAADANRSDVSRLQTVLGFTRLIALEPSAAALAFDRAIELDASDPLPRLGRGLTRIRQGRLTAGREEIELASMLDPGNSLIRSYLGKAYFEETRFDAAEEQYRLARTFDPADPTPWFYDAVSLLARNEPVLAYESLLRARELNDHRLVYRSRLLLDRDDASRTVSQGRIYRQLGFETLAIAQSSEALERDPLNHAAYEMLADSYRERERHELARASTLFKSRLLRPLTNEPVSPAALETDLVFLPDHGNARPSFNDYDALYEQEGLTFVGATHAGNLGQRGAQAAVAGRYGNWAASLGQMHRESDGFRDNNDQGHALYNVFVQTEPSPDLSMQLEARRRDTERGDLRLNQDPDDFDPVGRNRVESSDVTFGLRATLSRRDTLLVAASAIEEDDTLAGLDFTSVGELPSRSRVDTDGMDVQLQWHHRRGAADHVLGLDAYSLDTTLATRLVVDSCPLQSCEFSTAPTDLDYSSLYYRADVSPGDSVSMSLGASVTRFEDPALDLDERRWSPRVGLRWTPGPERSFRAAFARGIKKAPQAERTLEPTTLAGFNLLYDDFAGTRSDLYGLGTDWRVGSRSWAGLEAMYRRLSLPTRFDDFSTPEPISFTAFEDQRETTLRAYWNRIVNERVTIATGLLYERFERDDDSTEAVLSSRATPLDVTTFRLPLTLNTTLFDRGFMETELSYVDQSVERLDEGTVGSDNAHFYTLDLILGYRFPRTRGSISLDVRNLFDERFRYQDQNIQTFDASSPRLAPRRSLLVKLEFEF